MMLSNTIRKIIPKKLRPIGYLTHPVQTKTNLCVQYGPFKNMRYIESSTGSAYIPKLLGTYEMELIPYIEQACKLRFQQIINLGAGEGYYAVGMAIRNPSSVVYAFETTAKGRSQVKKMANLNQVSGRLYIHGQCEPEILENLLSKSQSNLIICDVEGYENVLLDLSKVPLLRYTTILVELHDFIISDISKEIVLRFSSTHHIDRIIQTTRTREDFPFRTIYTQLLPKSYLDWTTSEWRPEVMSWFWMNPRA